MTAPARELILIDTTPPGSAGSMGRYARLVEQVLRARPKAALPLRLARIHTVPPPSLRALFPRSIARRLGHLFAARAVARTARRHPAAGLHLLDGSTAFLLGRHAARAVVTCHDLIPLLQCRGLLGERPGPAARWLIERNRAALGRARALAAVSACTQRDLVERAGLSAGRVSVVPLCIDSALLPAAPVPRPDPAGRYVLHVGGSTFYKNRPGAVRAFARLGPEPDLRLIMAGAAPDRELAALARREAGGRVEFVPDPSDETLARLYRGAACLLFPSLYEGFGWPVLEAMAFGCPVVCSSCEALAEVAADAALTAPAADESRLAALCLSVLRDAALAAGMAARGRARAATFPAERLADGLLSLYAAAFGWEPA